MTHDTYWPRAIILVDMNAFFASIEQMDNPAWRGKPVAVTNGSLGSCIITCSYEARAYGIKTGMRLRDAKRLCPGLIQAPSRPKRYASMSARIMESLYNITPDVEVFSVDEAFLDVTHCQRLLGHPQEIGLLTKNTVLDASGLRCSVGVSGDKTTAKYAAKCQKPDGLTIISPWEARERLANVPVTDLCGIASGIGNFLARHGAYTCGDVAKLPISVLAQRYGNPGRRIWYMCQGADPEAVNTDVKAPKSMGHGKVMPPYTTDRELILTYLLHMTEKLAARLRRHDLEAQHYFIGLRAYQYGWLGNKAKLLRPSSDARLLYQLGREVIGAYWHGEPIGQIQVTALDPQPRSMQLDLFINEEPDRQPLHKAIDAINQRYGEFTLAPARLLKRSEMPNVIAPAWKPNGHRNTEPPTSS